MYPEQNNFEKSIPSKEGQKFFLEQACRSVTIEKQGEDFPLTKEKAGRVLLIGFMNSFFSSAKKHYDGAGEFRYSAYEIGPNETQWILDNLGKVESGYDTVIICVSSENHVKVAEYFKNSPKKVIILNNMSPVLSEKLMWADTILLGYSWRCDYSLKAMISALAGDFVPQGIKPYN